MMQAMPTPIVETMPTVFEAANVGDAARIFVLIPCAGQGQRAVLAANPEQALQEPTKPLRAKQYQVVHGQAVVAHTVQAFRALKPLVQAVYVVLAPSDSDFPQAFPGYGQAGEHVLRCGGNTRAATVQNGLQAMLAQTGTAVRPRDWVLVHDAARCLVTPEQIKTLVQACRHDPVGGLLAQKLPDTLKVEQGGRVAATLERSDKWLAQTPQMFRVGPLLQALQQATQTGTTVTDEASAMEAMGWWPKLVPGSAHNFKLTYPPDFALAQAVLQSRDLVLFPRTP